MFEPGFEAEVVVDNILISPKEMFVEPAHKVEMSTPVSVCSTFNCDVLCGITVVNCVLCINSLLHAL